MCVTQSVSRRQTTNKFSANLNNKCCCFDTRQKTDDQKAEIEHLHEVLDSKIELEKKQAGT